MSDLTDLEICKRIAFIEGYKVRPHEGYECCTVDDEDMLHHIPFDPLTDDALCFQLMVKHKIGVDWDSEAAWQSSVSTSYDFDPNNAYVEWDADTDINTVNKAICLAIIEAHKDER